METGVAKITGIWGIVLLGQMMILKRMANAGFTALMIVRREEDANTMAPKLFAIVTLALLSGLTKMRSRMEPLNGVALLLVGFVLLPQVDFIYCSPSPPPTSPGKIIHAQAKKTLGQPMASPSLGMGEAGQAWGIHVPSPHITNRKISNNLGLGQANVQTQGKRVYPPKPPTSPRMADHRKSPSSSITSTIETQGKRVYSPKPPTSPEMANHQIEGKQVYPASPEMASHRISNSPSSILAGATEAQAKRVLGSPSPSPDPDCTKAQVEQTIRFSFPSRPDSIEPHAQAEQTIGFSFPPRPNSIEAHAQAGQTIRSSFPRPDNVEAHAQAEPTLGSSPPLRPRDTKSQAKQISGSPIAPATPSVIPSSGVTVRDPPTSPPSPKMPIHQGDSTPSPGQAGPTGWVVQWGCEPPPNGCWWTYSSGPGMPSTVYPSGYNGPSPNLVTYGRAAGLSYGNGALYPGLYYYH
ncbi:hypothetical protein Cgig2_015583 [Carnegiea gigantea]|uniref:Uncharacterized protein n=1 Tax=Carnegiea gigantea TaxID=171969 RepID=A0A9Q1JHV5_9CARY|nr:hypothetical protein Cgig2_015583 [Carnegiea gigantea]